MLHTALSFSCTVGTELNLSTGYRHDNLQRTNCLQVEPSTITQKDCADIKHINLWQVGFNARLIASSIHNDCGRYSFF